MANNGRKRKTLIVTHPTLVKEWDYEKNDLLSPSAIMAGSHAKVWWKCSKGHEWQAAVVNRSSRGDGCPYCSGRYAIVGETDLQTQCPEVASEWNYEKNKPLIPTDVTFGSSKKVWWKCTKGHEWQAVIYSRCAGVGCPYCHGKRVIPGENDIATTNPKLIEEWNYNKNNTLSPHYVSAGSERKVWWICKRGHEWEASINHRASRGDGCPYCSGKKVLVGFNDLGSLMPDLVKEWDYENNDPLRPEMITAGSGKKVWWKCSKGHRWSAAPCNRSKGTGCPYCSGQKVFSGFNDLASRCPNIAKEWHYEKNTPLTPEMITVGSGKKVWWICAKGHEWESQVINRTSSNTVCPYCSGSYVVEGENDLESQYPEISEEWDYEKNAIHPSDVKSGSVQKAWWKCSKGHSYCMKIADRTSRGNNCPYCSNHRVLRGFNDLATTRPELVADWNYDKNNPLTPYDVTAGSNKKIWWKCSNGHEWKTSIANRTSKGDNCPYCSGRYAVEGKTDLLTLYPEIAKEWDFERNYPLTPKTITAGSSKKYWWKCVDGHSFYMSINHRTSRNGGCPFCSGHSVLPGYNDLASQKPDLAEEWDYSKNSPLTPKDVTTKSGKKVWWIGKCGHSWEAVIASRTSGADCPFCNKHVLLSGYNDLLTLYPNIAREWHPTKNGNLDPQHITAYNHKKVWWLGKCGHEWQSSVQGRVREAGCPYCSGKKVLVGFNDLETISPLLAKEWHPLKNHGLLPSQVTAGSGINVWWICPRCGNEWKRDVVSRKNGAGCPVCANEKQTSFPEQAVYYYISQVFDAVSRYNDGQYEIDIFLPDQMIGIEYDGSYYHNEPSVKERDEKKEKHFKDKGIRIIRIKEDDENYIKDDIVYYSVNSTYKKLPEAIRKVFGLIDSYDQIPNIDLARDQGKIYEQYIISEKENSLASLHPELLHEWDYEKNRINPSMVSVSSGKKVWWKCSICKHEWCTSIAHRVNGRNCPECSKKTRANSVLKTKLEKYGSLQDSFPDIAQEWHPLLNGELKPSSVLSGSSKKVWWKCSSCGFEWNSAISIRTRQNSGCPECGKQKSASSRIKNNLRNNGSLLDNMPELAEEWHQIRNVGLLPSDVTVGSKRKVWWKCAKCGNEWQAIVNERSRGNGCPLCAEHIRIETRIKRKIEKEGSLQDNNPSIASEWDFLRNGMLKPSDVTSFSREKVWWIGKCGHEWEDTISNRTTRKSGCPYCSNHRVLEGFNDLLSNNPALANEWNYNKNNLKPSEVTPNSGKKVWWKCSKGHEWEAVIYSRAKGSKCPICSNRQLLPGTNDLATTNPELCSEWDYDKNVLKPTEVLPGFDEKVWWICSSCGFEWQTRVRVRVKGYGCPNCARIRVTESKSKPIKCLETGVVYPSATEAARQTNINQSSISQCCNGKQEIAGGYHWGYL